MTLADLCAQFNLNIKTLLRDLFKVEIQAVDSETIKKSLKTTRRALLIFMNI